jgi:alpha-beta hydrolase superfamily lysophospholipase
MSRSSTPLPDPAPAPAPWTAETLHVDLWRDLAPARALEPDAVARDGGTWETGEQVLFWQAWYDASDEAPRRGVVALMHGYGEHSGRYDHVAGALVRCGYQVLAIDARGHGRSSGRRGHIEHFDAHVDDLALLVRRAHDRWPGLPLFVLGHSNGGLITLRYALRRPREVAGFVVSSPLCKVALAVPAAKELAGRIASRVWPTLSIPTGLDAAYVSHLEEVVRAYRRDPLVFGTTTVRWYTEAQHAMADLAGRAHTLDQPFLFLVAGADRIVEPQATRRVFHGLASSEREIEVYGDLYHEILNEARWRDVLRRAVLWMERRRMRLAEAAST